MDVFASRPSTAGRAALQPAVDNSHLPAGLLAHEGAREPAVDSSISGRETYSARRVPVGMDLRVIEKDENALSIEIAGEDHTFMNVLKGALLETDGVAAATYDMNPEQSGGQTDPVLTIKTEEGTDSLDALEAGTDRVIEKADALSDAYEAAV